jgi:hypothetical protein
VWVGGGGGGGGGGCLKIPGEGFLYVARCEIRRDGENEYCWIFCFISNYAWLWRVHIPIFHFLFEEELVGEFEKNGNIAAERRFDFVFIRNDCIHSQAFHINYLLYTSYIILLIIILSDNIIILRKID